MVLKPVSPKVYAGFGRFFFYHEYWFRINAKAMRIVYRNKL